MSLETVFTACNLLAMLGWVLLVLAPRRAAVRLVCGVVIPALLAVVYLALVLRHFGSSDGGFGSLALVARLFENPAMLLAGWVHYLVFDLFIGAWQTRDAARHGIPHVLVVPCLVLTFLLGPIGLLLYLALRTWTTRGVDLQVS